MLIKNGLVVVDGEIKFKDILIENEKIVEISDEIIKDGEEILDAKGHYIIPGIIDPHVHMRDPGLTHKEDFETGSKACAKGGVTTFFDMPNTIPNTITEEELLKKKKDAIGRSYVDYGFYFGGSKLDNSTEVEKVKDLVVATKVFMNVSTGNMLVEDEKILENIFKVSKLVGVHAEGEMVQKAIELSEKTGTPVYLCHLSTKEEVEMVRNGKKKGLKIYGEVTPHHLFLNEKDVLKNSLLRMKPELKTKEDNEALWEGIIDGTIDTIGTDHAPHKLEEKLEKLTFGIPGVEHSLEMMLKGVAGGRITLNDLTKIMSENTAKIFGIKNKGKLEIGYDADLVIINLETTERIKKEEVVSKCGWTPYDGFLKGGEVLTTIVRGNVVYNNKKFINKKIGKEVM
ncbi:MAG: dihydroorotase family protein [Fusobacterium perfoetens]|uniref:dihydroorotase n=1 Tax=Fusobacterium perfoetens TaxID=852 RepID=UPI0023F57E40|nr:dihydroorotase family protein [Fusobacterium perfoetens]MCI6151774.1 dihydroorotase family protein [Fusobacterium perfoetens]